MMEPVTLFEQLFFTTVYIEPLDPDHLGGGTGFMYQVPVGPEQFQTFLVTSGHVVSEPYPVRIRFLLGDPKGRSVELGSVHELIVHDPDTWFLRHGDESVDVAIAPMSRVWEELTEEGVNAFFRSFAPSMMFSAGTAEQVDALEPITLLGYPSGLYDLANYLPIARKGTTATPPNIDYNGHPTFLIDAAVFPGSSGSPVLIAEKSPTGSGGPRLLLLGVLSGIYERQIPIDEDGQPSTSTVQAALNIGLVHKASVIDQLVDKYLAAQSLKRFPETVRETDAPIVPAPSP